MRIFKTDINEKKEFTRLGWRYTQVLADKVNHVYLYEMRRPGQRYPRYELVKGNKTKNPDGSVVYTYPSDEDFGTSGWHICGSPESVAEKVCDKWLNLTLRSLKFRITPSGWIDYTF